MKPRGAVWRTFRVSSRTPRSRWGGAGERVVVVFPECGHQRIYKASKLPDRFRAVCYQCTALKTSLTHNHLDPEKCSGCAPAMSPAQEAPRICVCTNINRRLGRVPTVSDPGDLHEFDCPAARLPLQGPRTKVAAAGALPRRQDKVQKKRPDKSRRPGQKSQADPDRIKTASSSSHVALPPARVRPAAGRRAAAPKPGKARRTRPRRGSGSARSSG